MTFPLTAYIEAALERARYDKLEDGSFAGEIPKLKGVITFGGTLRRVQKRTAFHARRLTRRRREAGPQAVRAGRHRFEQGQEWPVGDHSKGVSSSASYGP
jgi:hypothetical protein